MKRAVVPAIDCTELDLAAKGGTGGAPNGRC
jgi:hypothetical protein